MWQWGQVHGHFKKYPLRKQCLLDGVFGLGACVLSLSIFEIVVFLISRIETKPSGPNSCHIIPVRLFWSLCQMSWVAASNCHMCHCLNSKPVIHFSPRFPRYPTQHLSAHGWALEWMRHNRTLLCQQEIHVKENKSHQNTIQNRLSALHGHGW